jgi:hypothetical protein
MDGVFYGTSRLVLLLSGTHCGREDSPLLYPDRFQSDDLGYMVVPTSTTLMKECKQLQCYRADNEMEAKSIYQFLRTQPSSKNRKREFVYGALYENIRGRDKLVVNVLATGATQYINILLPSGDSTLVRVTSACDELHLLSRISCLCDSLPACGNARKKSGDLGEMFVLGVRSTQKRLVYKPSMDATIAEEARVVMSTFANYVSREMPSEYRNIRDAEGPEKIGKLRQMGWEHGLCGSMIITKDLANSGHFDTSDRSRSVAIWTEKKPGLAENWYFVLPDVEVNGSRGLLIRLFHGAVVAWDGRVVRHCTSVTASGADNNVYSCFFSSLGD